MQRPFPFIILIKAAIADTATIEITIQSIGAIFVTSQ